MSQISFFSNPQTSPHPDPLRLSSSPSRDHTVSPRRFADGARGWWDGTTAKHGAKWQALSVECVERAAWLARSLAGAMPPGCSGVPPYGRG